VYRSAGVKCLVEEVKVSVCLMKRILKWCRNTATVFLDLGTI